MLVPCKRQIHERRQQLWLTHSKACEDPYGKSHIEAGQRDQARRDPSYHLQCVIQLEICHRCLTPVSCRRFGVIGQACHSLELLLTSRPESTMPNQRSSPLPQQDTEPRHINLHLDPQSTANDILLTGRSKAAKRRNDRCRGNAVCRGMLTRLSCSLECQSRLLIMLPLPGLRRCFPAVTSSFSRVSKDSVHLCVA